MAVRVSFAIDGTAKRFYNANRPSRKCRMLVCPVDAEWADRQVISTRFWVTTRHDSLLREFWKRSSLIVPSEFEAKCMGPARRSVGNVSIFLRHRVVDGRGGIGCAGS